MARWQDRECKHVFHSNDSTGLGVVGDCWRILRQTEGAASRTSTRLYVSSGRYLMARSAPIMVFR